MEIEFETIVKDLKKLVPQINIMIADKSLRPKSLFSMVRNGPGVNRSQSEICQTVRLSMWYYESLISSNQNAMIAV